MRVRYVVSDIRNVQNCVAILKPLNICAIKKSNFLGLARGKIWNSTGAQTLIIQEQNEENSAANSIYDQKIKAKSLNKTQFVALGFVIPRITLENCEETAKIEFHNVGKMNRSTSKVSNQGNLLKGIYNKSIL